MDCFNYKRRHSSEVQIGNTPLGGNNPIRVQTMANVSTMDTEASVEQAIRMIDAGAEYIRYTAQGEKEAHNLRKIRQLLIERGYHAPMVADIHFNPRAADVAATNVEKVRINPGNYVDRLKTFNHVDYTDEEYAAEIQKIRDRFIPFLNICKVNNTAIRIGVNHGSLSDRIMSRYGDTPEGMVESCMEFLRICRSENFHNVVISMKTSNTVIMVRVVRLLVRTMDSEGMNYPLHLGVTEAGDGEDGRIKSAVGIGTLLAEGVGDTIRVSLSEAPEAEIPVARSLVDYILQREGHAAIEGELSTDYDSIYTERRTTRPTKGIGGTTHPIVISDRGNGDLNFDPQLRPDYIYVGSNIPKNTLSDLGVIIDAEAWTNQSGTYPLYLAEDIDKLATSIATLKFICLTPDDLTERTIALLSDCATVVILNSNHSNRIGHLRMAMHRLMTASCDVPVILNFAYDGDNKEDMQLKSATDFGALLLDGFADGIMLTNKSCDARISDNTAFGILQATRTRISKTEFISCPGCGRTLYDLQTTIARVKEATSHLRGLKIGIMGCIVNGPGEMADADYGYVGAGRNQINLYKGKTCIVKGVPEDEAVERLVQLIKDNNDWQD
jgi:1-hydroxy-2-methyl-2-(E)-butenyl 4-diphosphate synthase